MAALETGSKAPDFELPTTDKGTLKLSEALQEGNYLILAFYPAAFSPVCGDELAMLQEFSGDLGKLNAAPVGISVDNAWSNSAFAESKGIAFPLLSDFHPKGAVATLYGVMREDGITERALFIVDPEGTIRYSYVSPLRENPGVDRLFDALEELKKGG